MGETLSGPRPLMSFSRLKAEAKSTTVLAVPLVLGQLSAVLMNVVDSALAGRLGARVLAAVGVGGALWATVLLSLIGILLAVAPSVSQLDGAKRRDEIGPLFRQVLWLALVAGVLFGIAIRRAEPVLWLLRVDAAVVPEAMRFLRAISWGGPALALYFAARYTSEGLSITRPTMYFGFLGLALIGPLGYVLMFGKLGLPALGAAGAGAATAIVLWIQAVSLLVWLARGPSYAKLGLFARLDPPRLGPIWGLLRLGLPMGASLFVEGSLFIVTSLLIGSLGPIEMAGHQIALMTASVTFMVPLGLGMATTVRIGNAVGRDDAGGVRSAGLAGFVLTLGAQGVSAVFIALFPVLIASAYTTDAAVIGKAAGLLTIAALFQLSDGLQAYFNGALRGLKDVTLPMLFTVVAYWGVGLPTGWWLGFERGWGARGLWLGLTAGLTVSALLLSSRFLYLVAARRWRRDPALDPTASPETT